MKIELTQNEANVLTGLIDIAVKSGGLQVAEAAVVLTGKIAAAAQAEAAGATAPVPPAAHPAPAAADKPTEGAKA